MAEIDTAALRDTADLDSRAGAPVGDALRLAADEIDRHRARLAQVEDENARLRMDLLDWQEQAEIRSLGVQMASEQRDQAFDENARLRARLAAVLALCEYHKYDGRVPIYPLRAAARGEGDRV